MELSLLSVTTTLLIGAGCFAIGYLIAGACADHHERGGGGAAAATTRSCSRFASWARSAVKAKSAGGAVSPVSRGDGEGEEDDDDEDEQEDEAGEWARQQRRLLRRNRAKQQQPQQPKAPVPLEIESLAEILEDFKMVLVVRNDLKMGKGKIAAQCSCGGLDLRYHGVRVTMPRQPHRTFMFEKCYPCDFGFIQETSSQGTKSIEKARAKSLKLPTHITIDAGRTQIAPNSRTVMAILGPADVVDDVTGGLKLL